MPSPRRFPRILRAPGQSRGSAWKITDAAHCGEITYEAEVDPNAMLICHCTDCQTLTGSAFRAVVTAPAAQFVLRTGIPKSYVKTAESGNKRRHTFCGNCGTPIYSCAVDNPQSYSLRIGAITQRAAFSPQRQIWRRSGLNWVDTLTAVPTSDEGFGGH